MIVVTKGTRKLGALTALVDISPEIVIQLEGILDEHELAFSSNKFVELRGEGENPRSPNRDH